MSGLNRRQWLCGVGALGLAAVPSPSRAIDPIPRPEGGTMRLSLAAYSFNRLLRLDPKAKPSMTLEQFIDFASKLPLDAVELTSYYFPTTEREYLAARKGQCTRYGLDVSGTAVGNDFCVVEPEKRREQMDVVKRWIEHTSLLGGKTIRIFAGRVPQGGSEEDARKRCIDGIEEACEYAGQYGILLALENHGGITATLEQILAIVESVKSEWFGVNLDSGNFHTADPYGDLAKLAPYAVNAQLKTEMTPQGGAKEDADLERLVEILKQVGYRGYVALEYEGTEDPNIAVPKYVVRLRELIG